MSARYELHGFWMSGPTYKVGLMLALAGEPYDYVHVALRAGEHKSPAFVAKQRYGQVPLLVDRKTDRRLTQSAAMLDYLATQLGKFGGANEDERVEAREWMFWEFDRLAMHIYRPRGQRLGIRSISQSICEMHFTEGGMALKVLDDHLKGRDWLVGKGLTIADIDIYGVVAYAGQGGYDLSIYPNLTGWMTRMESQPGFKPIMDLLPKA
jgi:glutathione S-transferase